MSDEAKELARNIRARRPRYGLTSRPIGDEFSKTDDEAAALIDAAFAKVREECVERAIEHICNSYGLVIGSQIWTEMGLRSAILGKDR